MLKIYTKTGDKGQTSLYDGTRISKHDIRVESYGTLDELNASIGLARQYCDSDILREQLFHIQRILFNVAGELATPDADQFPEPVSEADTRQLEQIIDQALETMDREGASHFIIPGSNLFSAALHVSRTVCRRAERRILELSDEAPVRPELIKYVNRLSDALYAIARASETELRIVTFKK
jgi:cob(I)alamin adenosyltransferase